MASPIPKPATQRQRRNRTTTAATLEAPSASRAELPRFRVSAMMCADCGLPSWDHDRRHFEDAEVAPHDYEPRELAWRPATRKWWDTIWASPIADEWVDADVPGLLALAVLVDEFWSTADPRVHAEMRQASREFGLSPLSRRQLQWEVKRVTTPPKPAPAPAPRRAGARSVLSVLQGRAG